MNTDFVSKCQKIGHVDIPAFAGHRKMMMPIVLGDTATLGPDLAEWADAFRTICDLWPKHNGKVGYLTLDEKLVRAGATHRRRGLHVDGIYRGAAGSWGGGGWGSIGNGMVTVSNIAGCRAYNQPFKGTPGDEGECDHLADQTRGGTTFEAGEVYWVDGLCVHESLPMPTDARRQFLRLSMPSCAPWFEGYSESPVGVLPTGPILPRREFMDA